MTTPFERPPSQSAAPEDPGPPGRAVPPHSSEPASEAPAPEAPAPEAPAPEASKGRPDFLHGALEWFWPNAGLGSPSTQTQSVRADIAEFERRARLAAELGRDALEPRRAFQHGVPDALACELYRQAIYWSLQAHALRRHPADTADTTLPESLSLARLWDDADQSLLQRAAGGAHPAAELGRFIAPRSYVEFAELEQSEQARLARLLHVFTADWLELLDARRAEAHSVWIKRLLRVGALAVALALIAFAAGRALDAIRWKTDFAAGSPWRASSRYPEHGCVTPDQQCAGPYFFSTNEEDEPWLELDLQREVSISKLEIENRVDCCRERAIPMVIEVSTDKKLWKTAARRSDEFAVWQARFAPTRARWVKILVKKRTNLHLRRVRIGP